MQKVPSVEKVKSTIRKKKAVERDAAYRKQLAEQKSNREFEHKRIREEHQMRRDGFVGEPMYDIDKPPIGWNPNRSDLSVVLGAGAAFILMLVFVFFVLSIIGVVR